MTVSIEQKKDLDLPDVTIVFYINIILTAEQEHYLKRIISGWYDVGAHGGFGGNFHFLDHIIFDDEKTISFHVDMGSAPIEALDVLYRIVDDALNMYGVQLEKIELE
jgi:hypothetical protein